MEISAIVQNALSDLKAQNTQVLDVSSISDVTDTLIIASGTSSRHVKSLAMNVVDELKKADLLPIGIEGLDAADWVLVDVGSIVVHVMLPETRQFYDLEKLWTPMDIDAIPEDDALGAPDLRDVN